MPIAELASHDDTEGVCWVRWRFDLAPEMVFTGLTDPIWLRRWLGVASGTFAPGGLVEVDHGEGQLQRSRVLACEPGRRLAVSWEFPGEPESTVEVRLEPAEEGCVLTLTHSGIGELAHEYAIGWHTHLVYLAGALRASPLALDRFWEVHERVSRAYA